MLVWCAVGQISLWRAHEAAIASVRHVSSPHNLVLASSQDTTVSLWTLQGGLVGIFGKHTWNLNDMATWQDPKVGIFSVCF